MARQFAARMLNRWNPDDRLGARGELIAVWYLRCRGFTILRRSWRTYLGEIDLIAVRRHTLVFVEVKTRRTHDRGHPAEAVTLAKQQQLTRLAMEFLKRHHLTNCRTRFDVIAITWPKQHWWPHIEHYVNAFEATQ